TKVEIKNLNSITAAANSVDYEIKRQREALEAGEKIIQETRGWDENKKQTFSQRTKEEAHDYRYFPEPDLPPLHFDNSDIEAIKNTLPELPAQRRERFAKQYGLPQADIEVLTFNQSLGNFFEHVCSELGGKDEKLFKLAANYLITEFQKHLGPEDDPEKTKITPDAFADLMLRVSKKEISSSAAQTVLEEMFRTGLMPEKIIAEKDLGQVSDTSALESVVDKVIADNAKAVEDYKNGKEASLKFLVGMAMRESKGKANPQVLEELIKNKLK
ncbi:MAG TPA: Asp-tRNA(Asn)/Glu-tRNA(Gln) amidotransferase subunit GatB, partial [Candidatus Paceibacterota bacterium]|nr:Asp-tRNA(Asn)/Glu-tRNA(Gln) amidotransferase subunit GatB [Candidatus Paceibacterota bacterium]